MKKLVLTCLLVIVLALSACESTQIEDGLSVGYEITPKGDMLPGFYFGVSSEETVFSLEEITLEYGIGIPTSAFLDDKHYKLILFIENLTTNQILDIAEIEVIDKNEFEFISNSNEGVLMIEYNFEGVIVLEDELLNILDSTEGTLLIGYKAIIINENNEDELHFSTAQRISYKIEGENIQLSVSEYGWNEFK